MLGGFGLIGELQVGENKMFSKGGTVKAKPESICRNESSRELSSRLNTSQTNSGVGDINWVAHPTSRNTNQGMGNDFRLSNIPDLG